MMSDLHTLIRPPEDREGEGNDGRARRGARDFDRNHEKILDAAAELLAENASSALTVALVAERSGLSAVTVYNHFPDAQAGIVVGVSSRVIARGVQRYVEQAPTLSGTEHPRAFLSALVDEFLQNRELINRAITVGIELAAENAWLPDPTDLSLRSIEMAGETVELPASAAELAVLQTTFFRGAMYAWCVRSVSDEEFARLAVQSFDVAIAVAEAGHCE